MRNCPDPASGTICKGPSATGTSSMPSRRRLLQTLGAVAAAGAGGWALLSGSRANAYYTGPASDHFDGVRFFNPSGVRPEGTRWRFSSGSWVTAAKLGRAAFPAPFQRTARRRASMARGCASSTSGTRRF